jgi:hypothetical protein
VRASADGAEPVSFTLRLTTRADGAAFLEPRARMNGRAPDGFVGQDQHQVTLARLDEPLSVRIRSSSASLSRAAVRFYFDAAMFEPEAGTRAVFIDKSGKPHDYVTVVSDANGLVQLPGLAGAKAGDHRVVALVPDASPADDNDPTQLVDNGHRAYAFDLHNVSPGVSLEILGGNFQGVETGQPFLRELSVRALATNPDPHVAPGVAHGLDGAELWFMSPAVTDDKTPAAALTGESVHTIVDSAGKAWRVVSVPIADPAGVVGVTAVANEVPGQHRIIAAYPSAFTDPASAPGRVEFLLCNGQPRSTPCSDAATTPGTIELVDEGPFFTLTPTPPPLRVRVKNQLGQVMAGTTVSFSAPSAGVGASVPWTTSRNVVSASVVTDADGIADGAPGFAANTANQEYVITAGAGTRQATLRFTRYAPPTTIAPVGPIASSVPVNTLHRALQVSTPSRAPIEWTVLPGPGGASATFAGGGLVARDIGPVSRAASTLYTLPALMANGTRGAFTLKATIIGTTLGVTFAMVNTASAPASIAAVDPGPFYTYTPGAPPLRVIVRDSDGFPFAGTAVKFSVPASTDIDAVAPWVREGNAYTVTIPTDAVGIADGRDRLGIRNAYSPVTVTAAVAGVSTPARLEVVRYGIPQTVRAFGPARSAALLGTAHASLTVEMVPQVPLRWTVVAGPSGAGGTFANGTTTLVTYPSSRAIGTGYASASVIANGAAGSFTLRVQPLDSSNVAPVDFQLANLGAAPASIVAADPAPLYTYNPGSPPLRVIVRDAAGAPVAGALVRFSVPASIDTEAFAPWIREGNTYTVTVPTDAVGIADGRSGLGIRNAYFPVTVTATTAGVAGSVRLDVTRYGSPLRVNAIGATTSMAAIGTRHAALRVEVAPNVPIRWTIIPAANGAGGTFANGTAETLTFPAGPGTGQSSATVTANGIAGTFILRAQAKDAPTIPPVDFTLTNLSALPASLERVDGGLLFTYTTGAPPMRVLVRDAGGAPIAGVPVTFESEGDISRIFERVNGRNVRTVPTDGDGIADGSAFLTSSRTYVVNQATARVDGVARTQEVNWIRYLPLDVIEPTDGLVYSGAPGAQHLVRVSSEPPVPLRWTIVAAPNGAGGAFLDGTTVKTTFPAGTSSAAQTVQLAVRANATRGVFTLKVEAVGVDGPAIVFAILSQ